MVEGYIIRHRSSAVAIISCGTVVRQVLFDLHLHWTEVEPMTLKKWTTGNGGAKKEQMALAIKERFGYSHASDDVIDAVALAQLGVHLGVIGADPTVKGLTPGW
jgi:Holliday junction resolvasome RuvABC endonuclease subunit